MGSSGYDYNSLAKVWWQAAWPILGRWLAFILTCVFWIVAAYIMLGWKWAVLLAAAIGLVLLLGCVAATVNYLIRRASMG